MVRSREAHKDFVNWGNGVLSSHDPSEMMKPLIYDELTSVVYSEYRIAKKFVFVCFLSLATQFLLEFSPISLFTSPPHFPPNGSSTSVVGVEHPLCILFLFPLPFSSIVERFPSLQNIVLVDSSEYMLSQATSLLNASRTSLSAPLPSLTTYASLLSVLEEVRSPRFLSARKNPSSISSVWTVFSANFHRTRRESPPSSSLGVLSPLFLAYSQSCFVLAALFSSPNPARDGGFIWFGVRGRWCCGWKRSREERMCWRHVRIVWSVP